jgi:hypothetical protein
MAALLTRLFAKKWQPLLNKKRNDLAKPLKNSGGDYIHPGVYLLAYSSKTLSGQRVNPRDVLYVGMTNSAGGLRSRLSQFQKCLEGGKPHGPGVRFYKKCLGCRRYSRLRKRKRFFFVALAVPCESDKSEAEPCDFVEMGKVASLEYEAIARVLRSTGWLPPLNDLSKDALDHVS